MIAHWMTPYIRFVDYYLNIEPLSRHQGAFYKRASFKKIGGVVFPGVGGETGLPVTKAHAI